MGICHVNKLVVGNKNTEKGSIQIYGKDIDALILGDPTHEGGDVKIYRDASGNLQVSIDADAASNAAAMSVYGGVVVQHYLTVGSPTLDTAQPLTVCGDFYCSGNLKFNNVLAVPTNTIEMRVNIAVGGTDAIDHSIKLQIDSNNILVIQATGDGIGGIDAATRAYGFFGVTPQVQQAHIADVPAAAGDPPTKAEFDALATKFNTLLADLEGYGHLKTS